MSVLDISKYIINRCIELDKLISNLKLQPILYYIQGECIRKTNGNLLFNEEFEAWNHGVVNRKAYDEFKSFGSCDIFIEQSDIHICESKREFIDRVLEKYLDKDLFELNSKIMNEEPWIKTYESNKYNIINNVDIISFFNKNSKTESLANKIEDKFSTIKILNDRIYNLKQEIKSINLKVLKDVYNLQFLSFIKYKEDNKEIFGVIKNVDKLFYENKKIICYKAKKNKKTAYVTNDTFTVNVEDVIKVADNMDEFREYKV